MFRTGPIEETLIKELADNISEILNTVGIFNRVFFRVKTSSSLQKKISSKPGVYGKDGKKVQDVFGIRVTLYFHDDEDIAIHLIKNNYEEISSARSMDERASDRFGPHRTNFIFKISDSLIYKSSLFDSEVIDSTFEVQFRTIFSEGWHEVEHDLRYKCKQDWEDENLLSRQLNGQYATLEACSWAMLKIFDELAYKKYKQKDWASFFRNALRIRFEDLIFSDGVNDFLTENPIFPKEIIRCDREKLILSLSNVAIRLPLKMDNVIFIINRAILRNQELKKIEPAMLKQILDNSFDIVSS